MEEKRTSIFDNILIWLGAGISIAEILTGTYFASLGFKKGLLAIVFGHLIAFFLMFLMGCIGGSSRKSAMETVKFSFGKNGAIFFSVLNILQLVGWTAIMIYDGAIAANELIGIGLWFWSFIIGSLIILWILIGIKSLGKINSIAILLLFILTVILSLVIFKKGIGLNNLNEDLSFFAAVELSVAMPLSWLPLISDYTKEAKEPKKASFYSAMSYTFISIWMYVVGMGAAIFTGESDIAKIMLKAGLGIVALLIVVFSTVTTTFLDVYSAGISAESISRKLKSKYIAIIVTVLGVFCAIFLPVYNISDFLYLIGSVFAPMVAIQISDFFILKRDISKNNIDFRNFIIWILGFIIYRILLSLNPNIITGVSILDIIITIILSVIVDKFIVSIKKNK